MSGLKLRGFRDCAFSCWGGGGGRIVHSSRNSGAKVMMPDSLIRQGSCKTSKKLNTRKKIEKRIAKKSNNKSNLNSLMCPESNKMKNSFFFDFSVRSFLFRFSEIFPDFLTRPILFRFSENRMHRLFRFPGPIDFISIF